MNPSAVSRSGPGWVFAIGTLALALLLWAALQGLGAGRIQVWLPAQIEAGDAAVPLPDGLRLGGAAGEARATLRWRVPASSDGGARWVLWAPRVPADRLQFSAPGWTGPAHDFFAPRTEHALPGGFSSPLPAGAVDAPLALRVESGLPVDVYPVLVRENDTIVLEQRAAAAASGIYAALFMLAFLALALYAAARDPAYLMYFACALSALLMLAAINGHLYRVAGLSWFGRWRTAGIDALVLGFLAAWSRMLPLYAGAGVVPRTAQRWAVAVAAGLLALAVLCLLDLPALRPWLHPLASAAWVLVGAGSLAWLALAVRGGAPMAWPLLGLLALTLLLTALQRALPGLGAPDPLAGRYAFQAGIVMLFTVLAVGLVSRVAEYRTQRDHDRLARADTERRMARETARNDLAHALQSQLRALAPGDIEHTAFALLFDHLLPLLPVDSAAAVAEGFHGRRLLVVRPEPRHEAVAEEIARRVVPLRRTASAGMALQYLLGEGGRALTEALIPLKVHAPGWGGVLLRREGTAGLSPEELALAAEFTRLTLLHVEHAVAAVQLRRSAELDALTGSLNRRSIDQWLARAFADAERERQPLSVAFIDVDHFKSVNDRYGHAAGDHCLRRVATALRAALGENGLFGRYGGEEFIAILPGQGEALARATGERIRAAVERLDARWEDRPLQLTVSVGVAARRDGERTPEATLARADKALYAAKRNGRNRVQVAPAVFD
ncbi:GGDEF domain-containing protein [Luteimonas huabeiensis]|uniref:GGDEF domain-containing protein n=1 Tax=Luteimonas huabeiensis TaxID=1244513 RepID=UPI00046621BD|nr:GGDEF domain-containing protein [Luteimonas huabeiensis]